MGLNLALVPGYGIAGAATSTFCSYLLLVGLTYAVSARVHPIRYDFRRALLPIGLSALLYVVTEGVTRSLPGPSLPVKAMVLAAYPALLYRLGFFRASERAFLRSLLQRRRTRSGAK